MLSLFMTSGFEKSKYELSAAIKTSHLTVMICVLLQRRTAPATEHAASVWISRAAGGAPTPVTRAKVSASRARTAGPSRPRSRPHPPSPASQPAPSRP